MVDLGRDIVGEKEIFAREDISEWKDLLKLYISKAGGKSLSWNINEAQELRSTIIPFTNTPGLFLINAQTKNGFRKFRASEIHYPQTVFYEPQSDLSVIAERWFQESIDEVIGEDDVDNTEVDTLTTEVVVECLQDNLCSHEEKRQLVIEAEAMEFTVEQERALKPILREFIETNRDNNTPEDLIAVGSAIRKYVAIINMSDMTSIASLLDPDHRATPSLEIELELMKMIARKFSANPPSSPNTFPKLAEQVADLAKTYLNPRILPKGKYAAVAMNGVQGLVYMVSDKCDEILQSLKALPFGWFCDQLSRRLERQVNEWTAKFGNDHMAVRHVKDFAEQIKPKINA